MKKNRIVVIDDDLFYLDQLKMILTAAEYDVVTAANAGDGIEALKTFRPVVLMLDWQLPDVSGIELLKTIRTEMHDLDLYVIMLSGRIMTENIVEAITAGADDYVIKPFSSEELFARIGHGVSDGRQRRLHTFERMKMLDVMRKLDAFVSQFHSVVPHNERSLSMVTEAKQLIDDMKVSLTLPADR